MLQSVLGISKAHCNHIGQLFDGNMQKINQHSMTYITIFRYKPNRNVYMCPPKDMYKNIHSNTIRYSSLVRRIMPSLKDISAS